MKLVIDQKREIADNIVEFEVRDAAGRPLPPFTPGAHVSVTGPGGLVRKYSLCNRPGEQDLTSHVDFEAVTRAARDAGAEVTMIATQGDWLRRLGIEARAAALAESNADCGEDIDSALQRLTASDQMGELFKVVALHSPDWPAPAGFE